jgi:hypothetical protein
MPRSRIVTGLGGSYGAWVMLTLRDKQMLRLGVVGPIPCERERRAGESTCQYVQFAASCAAVARPKPGGTPKNRTSEYQPAWRLCTRGASGSVPGPTSRECASLS